MRPKQKNITSTPWERCDVAGGGSVLNTDDGKVCPMDFCDVEQPMQAEWMIHQTSRAVTLLQNLLAPPY